jgi:hypothetical protein
MDDIISVIAKTQIVGQDASKGQTNLFGFTVNKFRTDEIGSKKISTIKGKTSSEFKMPSSLDLKNASNDISMVVS